MPLVANVSQIMDVPSILGKKMITFDLDGTLTESKSPMDAEMADLLGRLLLKLKISIISGGAFEQFERQMPALKCSDEQLKNLFFFPTTGTRFYRYADGWTQVYAEEFTDDEKKKIWDAFEKAYAETGYHDPEVVYGDVVEDRGSQFTFSVLGQKAPLELKLALKKSWETARDPRTDLAASLQRHLPEFDVKIPGVTSIDITRKGIDKAYGIGKIEEILGVTAKEMIFVGDALYEGGNDYAVIRTGVETVAVKNQSETKVVLKQWLAELGG